VPVEPQSSANMAGGKGASEYQPSVQDLLAMDSDSEADEEPPCGEATEHVAALPLQQQPQVAIPGPNELLQGTDAATTDSRSGLTHPSAVSHAEGLLQLPQLVLRTDNNPVSTDRLAHAPGADYSFEARASKVEDDADNVGLADTQVPAEEDHRSMVSQLLAEDSSDEEEGSQPKRSTSFSARVSSLSQTSSFRFSRETSLLFDSDEDENQPEVELAANEGSVQDAPGAPLTKEHLLHLHGDLPGKQVPGHETPRKQSPVDQFPARNDPTGALGGGKQVMPTFPGTAATVTSTSVGPDPEGRAIERLLTAEKMEARERRASFFHKRRRPEGSHSELASSRTPGEHDPSEERGYPQGSHEQKQDGELKPFMGPLEMAEEKERELVTGVLANVHGRDRSWMGSWASPIPADAPHTRLSRSYPPENPEIEAEQSRVQSMFMPESLKLSEAGALASTLRSTKNGFGIPQCIAVHTRGVAVGTSEGAVLVAASECPFEGEVNHSLETMISLSTEEKTGTSGAPQAPVTALGFHKSGHRLFVGRSNGVLQLWDSQKQALLKVLSEHTYPVAHVVYLEQREDSVVTADSSGMVLLHSFSQSIFKKFSVNTACLLDGKKLGPVLAISPLRVASTDLDADPSASAPGSSSISPALSNCELVALCTTKEALLVRLAPELSVVHKWRRDVASTNDQSMASIRDGALPSVAWRCVSGASDSTSSAAQNGAQKPQIAVAWGRTCRLFEIDAAGLSSPTVKRAEVSFLCEWQLDVDELAGVLWLEDQLLAAMNVRGLVYLLDPNTKCQLTIFELPAGVVYHSLFSNAYGSLERSLQNSYGVRGGSMYVLTTSVLYCLQLIPWQNALETALAAYGWSRAMSLALGLFSGDYIKSMVSGLPRDPGAVKSAMSSYLPDFVMRIAHQLLGANSSEDEGRRRELRAFGAAMVEFCITVELDQLLFGDMFQLYEASSRIDIFLESLEPYILSDVLTSLPPEIMQHLVEHYSSKGEVARIEACVFHMNVYSLDFNQVVRLCKTFKLYSALADVFTRGLKDFITPFEYLLEGMASDEPDEASELGYKLLLYLRCCFRGECFPPGRGRLVASLGEEAPPPGVQLLQQLIQVPKDSSSIPLRRLLAFDTVSTLRVLEDIFREDPIDVYVASLAQPLVDSLIALVGSKLESAPTGALAARDLGAPGTLSLYDRGVVVEFVSMFVVRRLASVPEDIHHGIISQLASPAPRVVAESSHLKAMSVDYGDDTSRQDDELPLTHASRERRLMDLVHMTSETDLQVDRVLHLAKRAKFYTLSAELCMRKEDYMGALECHLQLGTVKGQQQAPFSFINKMMSAGVLSDVGRKVFKDAVLDVLPSLVETSSEGTIRLVVEHFPTENDRVLHALEEHPNLQLLYVKGIMNSTRAEAAEDVSAEEEETSLAELIQKSDLLVTEEMCELYVKLLCKFEPSNVYFFLVSSDHYGLESCLQLCQEHGIPDGSSYLLERMGDLVQALEVILSGLRGAMQDLKELLHLQSAPIVLARISNDVSAEEGTESLLGETDIESAYAALQNYCFAAIQLCKRNSDRLEERELQDLWFSLMDTFVVPLRNMKREGKLLTCAITTATLRANSHYQEILSRNVSLLLGHMMNDLPVHSVLERIVNQHTGDELGDFRDAIGGIMDTLNFEKAILSTARSVIGTESFNSLGRLKTMGTHGLRIRDVVDGGDGSQERVALVTFDGTLEVGSVPPSPEHLCNPKTLRGLRSKSQTEASTSAYNSMSAGIAQYSKWVGSQVVSLQDITL